MHKLDSMKLTGCGSILRRSLKKGKDMHGICLQQCRMGGGTSCRIVGNHRAGWSSGDTQTLIMEKRLCLSLLTPSVKKAKQCMQVFYRNHTPVSSVRPLVSSRDDSNRSPPHGRPQTHTPAHMHTVKTAGGHAQAFRFIIMAPLFED